MIGRRLQLYLAMNPANGSTGKIGSFDQLRVLVRVALDLYAMELARSKVRPPGRTPTPRRPSSKLRDLKSVLSDARDDLLILRSALVLPASLIHARER